MKTIIAGGTGFLGEALAHYLLQQNAEVVILTRKITSHTNARQVLWDGINSGAWVKELEHADAIVNLCGKSVDCRYTKSNKEKIYSSRIQPTIAIAQALDSCAHPPRVWINASSATIYRASHHKLMDEFTGEVGDDFSEDVCNKWEAATNTLQRTDVRKVILRIAITLGNNKGALLPLKLLSRIGLGGHQGTGNQSVSWVHNLDFCRVVEWAITQNTASGVYNVVAPQTVSNKNFMQQIRETLHVPFGLSIPIWLLELGAIFIRTETELVFKSRNVFPSRLLNEGFSFQFSELKPAIEDCFLPQK
ncbi:MAG: TIGR01777 family oxidoreductase [Cytophagales bacterium]|nr:TIGR01777 family oxidoreductase [Cytophagales bacterium]